MSLSHSETLANIAPALVKAQATLQNVRKENTASVPTKSGGKYEYSYADLTAVLDAVKPVLAAFGLSASQHPGLREDTQGAVLTIETLLLHESGEWILSEAATPLENTSPQGTGGAITYLRRYALAAILGIGQEDDDGASASKQGGGARKREERRDAPPAAADGPHELPSKAIGDKMRELNISVGEVASTFEIESKGETVVAFIREQVRQGKTLDDIMRHVALTKLAWVEEQKRRASKADEPTVEQIEQQILADPPV